MPFREGAHASAINGDQEVVTVQGIGLSGSLGNLRWVHR